MIAGVRFQAGNAFSAVPGRCVSHQASRPWPVILESTRRPDDLPSLAHVANAPRRIPAPDLGLFLPIPGATIAHCEAAAA
ncbi:hypothetical protein LGN30_19820 [Burkholderia seminalis]|uniref:hypothetical protein n=1 Tax=Burkholderia seminalis TaxID=488731 RepID=UPI001CF2B603|nr:hypothetical protein [Burkholderia seminalis]MCA8425439.1 hypothetical protein [Burkholderia seminalis]